MVRSTMEYRSSRGEERLEVSLQASDMGNDLVVLIFNQAAHIGAVAVGEFDFEHNRASVSVVTRLGHKDDALAQKAAYLISKNSRRPVCVIAGVHLDDITPEEISSLMQNSTALIEDFIRHL
jgi:gallate decarboxylase subunit D